MSDIVSSSFGSLLSVEIPPRAELFGGMKLTIQIPPSGMLTLLGPNGSGKSQVMRQITSRLRTQLREQGHVLMLAAGRLQPFEGRRMLHSLPHGNLDNQPEQSITLAENYLPRWHEVESTQGVINRLAERVDLQIKVGERLRALFGRELHLIWVRGNLKVEFARGGAAYPSAKEASGLLHLVAILAALYDNELAAVLIDEPGISLHPQYQAFVRREMERAAGNPADGKKLVVCATHAPAMIGLRQATDLCNIVFFRDIDTLPVQVDSTDETLRSQKLGTFVRSLGASHREALFATRPLLVEGPSDELVIEALDDALDVNLHASGGHIVQAIGKDTMPTILKLLRLIGKKPVALADLDGFTDNLLLVNAFNDDERGRQAAAPAENLHAAVKPAHDALCEAVNQYWSGIEGQATSHPYWENPTDQERQAKQKRRAAAAVLLRAEQATVETWPNGETVWGPLRHRLTIALDLLEVAGLFVLRYGTIEDDYAIAADRNDKVGSAAEEADGILANPNAAARRHSVALRALKRVSPALPIDESAAVRVAFESVIAPVVGLLRDQAEASVDKLRAVAERHAKDVAPLFEIERVERDGDEHVDVSLSASVLDVEGFPVSVRGDDDVVAISRRSIRQAR